MSCAMLRMATTTLTAWWVCGEAGKVQAGGIEFGHSTDHEVGVQWGGEGAGRAGAGRRD